MATDALDCLEDPAGTIPQRCDRLVRHVYGAPPAPPEHLAVATRPWPEAGAEILTLTMSQAGRRYVVEAALLLPPGPPGRVPLVVGLGFLGPLGAVEADGFPRDPHAIVEATGAGFPDGRLVPAMRGVHASRWPRETLHRAGAALLLACYGSFTPDDPHAAFAHGVAPLMGVGDGLHRPGAIALWAWGYSRLVDAALARPEIDPGRIVIAGHSRLGKAALVAAAQDARIAGVFANNSGCLGARPSAIRRGETPEALAARFPHWVTPAFAADPRPPEGGDQPDLLAAIAPRRLYVASASEDAWADPAGERAGLAAAAPAWRALGCAVPAIDADAPLVPGDGFRAGPLAWHLRPGPHDLTPYDWQRALPQLLEPTP
ncbi:MAG: hypothetical protein ACFE0R_18835 [Salinarimonas sp.]